MYTLFRKFVDALRRFMFGRYGADQLFYALIIIFFIINLVNTFIGSLILMMLQYAIFFWSMFRYFSKNIYKRRDENRKFLGIWQKIKSFFTFQRDKIRDRKICRYRKCKHCHAALRLPIKKGKNSVKCPRCGKSFNVRIWF